MLKARRRSVAHLRDPVQPDVRGREAGQRRGLNLLLCSFCVLTDDRHQSAEQQEPTGSHPSGLGSRKHLCQCDPRPPGPAGVGQEGRLQVGPSLRFYLDLDTNPDHVVAWRGWTRLSFHSPSSQCFRVVIFLLWGLFIEENSLSKA